MKVQKELFKSFVDLPDNPDRGLKETVKGLNEDIQGSVSAGDNFQGDEDAFFCDVHSKGNQYSVAGKITDKLLHDSDSEIPCVSSLEEGEEEQSKQNTRGKGKGKKKGGGAKKVVRSNVKQQPAHIKWKNRRDMEKTEDSFDEDSSKSFSAATKRKLAAKGMKSGIKTVGRPKHKVKSRYMLVQVLREQYQDHFQNK